MDKRCLNVATVSAIWSTIIAIIVLSVLNLIFHNHTLYTILCFSLIYGIGTHMGFCLGFSYKSIPASLPLFLVIAINAAFIFLPVISKQEGAYGINLAILFDFAYMSETKKGRAFFDKLEKEEESDDNDSTSK